MKMFKAICIALALCSIAMFVGCNETPSNNSNSQQTSYPELGSDNPITEPFDTPLSKLE